MIKGCALGHVDIKFPRCVQSVWLILAHVADSDARGHLTWWNSISQAYVPGRQCFNSHRQMKHEIQHTYFAIVCDLSGSPKKLVSLRESVVMVVTLNASSRERMRAGRRVGTWDSGRPGSLFWLSLLFTV